MMLWIATNDRRIDATWPFPSDIQIETDIEK